MPGSLFLSAAAYLSNSPSLTKVSTELKLELYGLFKRVSVAEHPTSGRPSIFDPAGRAKWDAWSEAGVTLKGDDGAIQAEARYVAIAIELGFGPEANTERSADYSSDEVDLDRLDNDDSDESPDSSHAKFSGFGGSTSIMSKESDEEFNADATTMLHDLALDGDSAALKLFLDQTQALAINERDTFGYCALHLAADRGHCQAVVLLLEAGADPSVRDGEGLTAQDLAQEAGNLEVVKILQHRSAK